MSNQKQLIRVFVLIILFTFGCCISAFSQKIPEDLLARISKFQEEVKQAPTTPDSYRSRWNTLRMLYGEQTKYFENLDLELELLRDKAKYYNGLIRDWRAGVSIEAKGIKMNPEEQMQKFLDEAIMRLGKEKSPSELENEKEKFRKRFPSDKIRYSTTYEGRTYNVYWGELHGHTYLSDGVNSPNYYYTFSIEIANLDYCALTDHSWSSGNKEERWKEIFTTADNLNEPGKFAALPGVEWSSSYGHGHINLIYYDYPYPETAPASRLDYTNNVQTLFDYLEKEGENVVVIRNHTGSSSLGTDWNYQNPKWNYLIDIVSSITFRSLNYYSLIHERTLETALKEGYRFGFVGTSDTHTSWPGSGNITAVFSPSLTRKDIGINLKNRFCYAAEDRIFVDFRINGKRMGSEISAKRPDPLEFSINVEGTDEINSIIVIKNNRTFYSFNLRYIDGENIKIERTYERPSGERPSAVDCYFVIVTQNNGKRAWSSPIWVTTEL